MTKKQDQESLINALKDNVDTKQKMINSLISENRELEERLLDMMVDYYHYVDTDVEDIRAYAQAKKLLEVKP